MNVFINDLQENIAVDITALHQAALRILSFTHCEQQCELSIALVDDREMRRLNLEYRGIDRSTDVLSFALQEAEEPPILGSQEGLESFPIILGDVILSIDTIQQQAQEFGHSFEEELYFLVIHGILHLVGYDHQTDEEAHVMENLERRIMNSLHIHRHEL